ncbi:MAG TPA: excinuclease ABC subunit UvrA [Opitutales bacterium]|jgi:excinuclease ABC subunit A|nr:excinuclease ABC subunit UvrA [Opitutales bacterium]
MSVLESIRLRGVRQNNLRGFDLDLPLGKLIVVTGLSGAGKSSLVFETLHAEGQRRYVETFSAYTRQFLERLDRPRVDEIENIRPSIAIEQTNTVKTSRSTVGTMTELCDYFKAWWPRVAQLHDPDTGKIIADDNPRTIWKKAHEQWPGASALVAFAVRKPKQLKWEEIFGPLRAQGYARAVVSEENKGAEEQRSRGTKGTKTDKESAEQLRAKEQKTRAQPDSALAKELTGVERLEDLEKNSANLPEEAVLLVVQDRVTLTAENELRFLEAARTALHFGQGAMRMLREDGTELGRFSEGLHSPHTGRKFRPATAGMFSFNSPLGACAKCRGFGRVIELNERLVLPNPKLSIAGGVLRPFQGEVYGESLRDLMRACVKHKIPTDVPWREMSAAQREFVMAGDPDFSEDVPEKQWYGVRRFFTWLEGNTYKMHVRVFLSKYRTYKTCPDCGGARLKPEALWWKWQGRTLPDLYRLPVSELLRLLEEEIGNRSAERGNKEPNNHLIKSETSNPKAETNKLHEGDLALEGILTRLRYLREVGLDYLTLDRATRTLSGGETERVNLTTCLGSALVETLFVLDEPSVGLHPRDIHRLIAILRRLADQGNTVVVVEHDEAVMRAADHIVEIGPQPGKRGGRLVFSGTVAEIMQSKESLTGAYLSGRKKIATEQQGTGNGEKLTIKKLSPASSPLTLEGVTLHNLRNLNVSIPAARLVGLCGVSGSGKSTLLERALYDGLRARRGEPAEEPAAMAKVKMPRFAELVLVDQSPVSRTPRSNAALYCGAWEGIRNLFAEGEGAKAAGFTARDFSFNAGEGRCPHCQGLGSERVEMQFMSDLYVPCPECGGKRFKPEILKCAWKGHSVAEVLELEVGEAVEVFAGQNKIAMRLRALMEVGLSYLPLGQPLNTLSGGESQRLKLVRYLGGLEESAGPSLLLLDEPTTGLHRDDVGRLLQVLRRLVERGHSVVVVEHQPDVLAACDWLIELGPEAGAQGGKIVAEGTPEAVAKLATATSPFLRQTLAATEKSGTRNAKRANSADQEITASPDAMAKSPGQETHLRISGAREHNLKNISLEIPRRKFVVLTGVSGSGKSSLAFDIIFAEGQRRFMESMSAYARQFVEQMPRPDVDEVAGLPPTVAIEQRVTRGGRKSTVATVTEVAPYLRLLFARLGVPHSLVTGKPLVALGREEIARRLRAEIVRRQKRGATHLYLFAPLVRGRKGHHQPLADWARNHGHELMRCDGKLVAVNDFQKLDRYREHDVEVAMADFGRKAAKKISHADIGKILDGALKAGSGACFLLEPKENEAVWFSTTRTDPATGEAFPELDPKHFSWNSPRGWCPRCRGYGRLFAEVEANEDLYAEAPSYAEPTDEICPECEGERLNPQARAVKLYFKKGPVRSLPELVALAPDELLQVMGNLDVDARGKLIAGEIIPQMAERLKFLDRVGLDYLTLDRSADTLSGGEAQRIRLAAQLGSNLAGVLYVLDEPSIGLHARDNERLIASLRSLQKQGNSLLVVEHDEEMLRQADQIIDLGPGAGKHGGQVVAQGSVREVLRHKDSLTGKFLREGLKHPQKGTWRDVGAGKGAEEQTPIRGQLPSLRSWVGSRGVKGKRPSLKSAKIQQTEFMVVRGAKLRNLKGDDARFPLGRLIVVCGPSGAGKSTLVRDVLEPAARIAVQRKLARVDGKPWSCREVTGANNFGQVIEVGQDPIGQTPRSTPATYIGAFEHIRALFAQLPEARLRGHEAGWFSFNVKGGRCETCAGAGRVKLEMSFLPEAWLPCEDCGGDRYGPELRELRWNGKNLAEVLRMSFEEAAEFFAAHGKLNNLLKLMNEAGLGYLTLGQSSPTLSGGEAQRLKLVSELARGLPGYAARMRGLATEKHLYILEEPTIGLHQSDVARLIDLLQRLVDQGHTVIIIEHHLDIIAEADWVVEMGPEGGDAGGRILYQGPVAGLAGRKGCPTGPYLVEKLKAK